MLTPDYLWMRIREERKQGQVAQTMETAGQMQRLFPSAWLTGSTLSQTARILTQQGHLEEARQIIVFLKQQETWDHDPEGLRKLFAEAELMLERAEQRGGEP